MALIKICCQTGKLSGMIHGSESGTKFTVPISQATFWLMCHRYYVSVPLSHSSSSTLSSLHVVTFIQISIPINVYILFVCPTTEGVKGIR